MARSIFSGRKLTKHKKRNKGVHAKCKCSKNKGSTMYVKPYRGQGRTG